MSLKRYQNQISGVSKENLQKGFCFFAMTAERGGDCNSPPLQAAIYHIDDTSDMIRASVYAYIGRW